LGVSDLVFMDQNHGNTVLEVTESNFTKVFSADALVTSVKGIALAVLVADCVPILLHADRVVGVIHAGRRGMTNGIISNTVSSIRKMGAGVISAVVGPCICAKCYEVSPEMYEAISRDFPASSTSSISHSLDLRAGVSAQLEAAGVRVSQVEKCTLENPAYFSYRQDGESRRLAGVVAL
jgi:YfiH family protein